MNTKIIPGPEETPFLGSIRPFQANPPQFLTKLAREYGPIARFNLFNLSMYLVTDPDYIRDILVTNHKQFPKSDVGLKVMRRFLGIGLLTSEGAYHRQQRKLAQPAFHMRRIAGYADIMTDYTQRHLATWQDGEVRDVSEEMMALTMYIVCKTLFDADMDDMQGAADSVGKAIHILQQITNDEFKLPLLLPTWLPTPNNRRRKEQRSVLYGTLDRIIDERQGSGPVGNQRLHDTGDLLSMLLLAQDEAGKPLSKQQLRDEVVTLFAAGHETTANTLTWAWYLLSQYPAVEARLHEEVDRVLGMGTDGRLPTLDDLPRLPYTEMVVKETLRLYPPAWGLASRQAAGDTEIGGYSLPKDSLIFISPYVVHRLPHYYPDPERFDPERFTPEREKELPRYAYIPFGAGPHVCIGNGFAMMEAQLLLATIAQRYRLTLRQGTVGTEPLITLGVKDGLRMMLAERTAVSAPVTQAVLAA
jgi:cytochrome P450